MRPRWTPISMPSCARHTRASAAACASCRCMASSRAADGARRPCCRRNQRSRFFARCGASDASRAKASRSSADAMSHAGDDAFAGIDRSELVEQRCRLRLVRSSTGERRRIAGKCGGESRRDLVAQEIALQRRVGIGLVVDPAQARAPAAYASIARCRIAQGAGAAARIVIAEDECSGIAASPCGPAPRSN